MPRKLGGYLACRLSGRAPSVIINVGVLALVSIVIFLSVSQPIFNELAVSAIPSAHRHLLLVRVQESNFHIVWINHQIPRVSLLKGGHE